MIKTSILTCTHNMLRFLPAAIHSAISQELIDWEYLILDDGSTDGTWDYLQEWASHPSIRLFRHTERKGLTECRKFLLEKSQGEYLSILDADDLLFAQKGKTHAAILEGDPHVGVVWGRSLLLKEGKFEIIPSLQFEQGWDLVTPYQATHSAMTWRKSALIQAGGYDPEWTLVEAPDLFFKVGDFAKQHFCDNFAAVKRVLPDNIFRQQLSPTRREALSQALVRRTIQRRYSE